MQHMSHTTSGSASPVPSALLRWTAMAALVGLLFGLVAGVVMVAAGDLPPGEPATRSIVVVAPARRYEVHAAVRSASGTEWSFGVHWAKSHAITRSTG
jgi:hypothetical protein